MEMITDSFKLQLSCDLDRDSETANMDDPAYLNKSGGSNEKF